MWDEKSLPHTDSLSDKNWQLYHIKLGMQVSLIFGQWVGPKLSKIN
jgi:hypothetical protein